MEKSNYEIGNVFLARGEIDKAMDQYDLFLKENKNHDKVCDNLGVCYFKKNEYTKANYMFSQALRINPGNKTALRNKEIVLKKLLAKITQENLLWEKQIRTRRTPYVKTDPQYALKPKKILKERIQAKEYPQITKLDKWDLNRNYFEPGDFNPHRPREKSEDLLCCLSCGGYYINPTQINKEPWKGWHNHCEFCQI